MNREIITLAGSPGSGKSSTAKAVAAALEFRHFSSGDLFRQLAAERGESIEAMNISAEVQQDIDRKVDDLLKQMYAAEEKLVIDSRMAWRWMPRSFKVFLVLDPDTAAERIRTVIPRATLNYLSVPVAEVKGFFRAEGLENETIVIPGSTSIAALVSGDVDYSGAGGTGMRAAVRGAPIKAVIFQTEKVTW